MSIINRLHFKVLFSLLCLLGLDIISVASWTPDEVTLGFKGQPICCGNDMMVRASSKKRQSCWWKYTEHEQFICNEKCLTSDLSRLEACKDIQDQKWVLDMLKPGYFWAKNSRTGLCIAKLNELNRTVDTVFTVDKCLLHKLKINYIRGRKNPYWTPFPS